MVGVSLILVAAFAQQSPEIEGMAPYMFRFNTGREDLYAYIRPDDLDRVAIPVVIDEPWNKRVVRDTIQRSYIEAMEPDDLSALREGRREAAWTAAGGEEIQDRSGKSYWVLKSDREKQRRMEAMVASAFPAPIEAPPDAEIAGEMKEGAAKGPGFLRLWGMHAAIAGAALAAAGAVVWWTFRRSWSTV